MPLESATTIDMLDATNPGETDGLGQADDHLRMIKACLKGSLPGLVGTTAITTADLDWVHTNRGPIDTQRGKTLFTDTVGAWATSADVWANSLHGINIDATGYVLQQGNVLVPRGVVVMWCGSLAAIPAGWGLCDGSNGTPDLRAKFVYGAGGVVGVLQSGGAASALVGTDITGGHYHTSKTGAAGGHTPSVSVGTAGDHSHAGGTGWHALTVDEMPSHDHGLGGLAVGVATGAGTMSWGLGSAIEAHGFAAQGSGIGHGHLIFSDGSHTHTATAGAVADHQHTISIDGNHQHLVSVPTIPPYVALAFIMKL